MLFQVGGQGSRPTFFEMAAAQQLPASLRAALTYSIGVLALRRPFFHKILDYDDEFFSLLMMALETHSLRTTDASFSESLYGLRRRPVKVTPSITTPHADVGNQLPHSGLEKRQKILSVVFLHTLFHTISCSVIDSADRGRILCELMRDIKVLPHLAHVVLPYFNSKLQSIYNKEREAMLQASLWGHGDENLDDSNYPGQQEEISPLSSDLLDAEPSQMTRLWKKIQKIVGACYPWIHATNEGLSFAYQLLYLLDATGFYTPGLHVLQVHVCRATGQELMDTSSRISKIRSRERERLRGPPWLKALQRVLLSCIYTTLDYAQTGLITAVFFFKMMEWWYQSAEERMSAPTVYPPPPPPPPPKVAQAGIQLPPDRRICPLCFQKRANPSVVSVSGFVFCYSCIYKYISQYNRCPVTLVPATVDQIRRLFHDA